MTYSESKSETDFSFDINSASDFESGSESDSESDLIQSLQIWTSVFFLPYIYTLLNKLVDDFFLSILITESIVIQAMQA